MEMQQPHSCRTFTEGLTPDSSTWNLVLPPCSLMLWNTRMPFAPSMCLPP